MDRLTGIALLTVLVCIAFDAKALSHTITTQFCCPFSNNRETYMLVTPPRPISSKHLLRSRKS